MSASTDDILGNAMTEPIEDISEGVSSPEVEIEVVDDRPAEDQVSPRDPDRASDFDPDEEIADVGGRAGKRIKQLRYEYHEQRRGKEAAEKMREEAVGYAQNVANQNSQLRELLERGEKVLLSEIKARTESDISKARDRYRAAHEEGDAEALLKAQEELNRSQYDSRAAESYQPLAEEPSIAQQREFQARQQAAQQQAAQQQAAQAAQQRQAPPKEVDPKLRMWLSDNDWFGKDSELTSFAYGVHEKLVKENGLDPRSEEYYSSIDRRMREVFPAKFGVSMGAEEPSVNHRTTTVVAPARRSVGPPRKVQLTSTQVALAKRLGLAPEQYAKQLLKERGNG